ncbi:N-acetylmuramic acid 6-phosphate etherase [Halobacillus sp. A1]|uniref:N-acetylmuramic acid 6-phosphate etherase n=1 Tax=Halobacillus sp. A1 TaxID=2880262 RepID=UPI0020A62EFB|nr:N-acetylmuramic acid 6-phosphate etherase [Halobacillus sp. A1]MCP3030854.1 N-acetylmuramic acid 6-phosphate etherase [Halobacillus sp. A1]
MELSNLTTEQRNKNSLNLDKMSILEALHTMNKEDKKVAEAVESVLPKVETSIEKMYVSLSRGGRLFYVGAGTSGRLGVIDASECPPTFMTPPHMVQALMAGGEDAFFSAVEGSEDNEEQGAEDLKKKQLTAADVVVGITASGRTPYPIGALKYARSVGAYTVSLSCNERSEISQFADCDIEVVVGPEVLTGSTRLKAATAHKMVLNMMSTTTMIKLGKVHENLMVDVHASNYKLIERAKKTIMEITKVTYEEAEEVLKKTNHKVKPAVVMIDTGATYNEAEEAIKQSNGYVREAIAHIRKNSPELRNNMDSR